MKLETNRFGVIALQDGEGQLPARDSAAAPIALDLVEVGQDAEALAKVGRFLDALASHVETAKAAVLAEYEGLAGFVPEWLEEEAPDAFASVFPKATSAADVTAQTFVDVLRPSSVWAGDRQSITIDLAIGDAEIDHKVAAYFDLNGTLDEVGIES